MPSTEHEPPMRTRLLEAAARLLAEEGPGALSVRRVAGEVGASTMAVYTHFGGMRALIHGVAREGFVRLAARLADVPRTDDPLADLVNLGLAYRGNALANPYLYAVMFGAAPLGEYRPVGEDIAEGGQTFMVLVDATRRVMDAGRFRSTDPVVVAAQLWSALHGFTMLELAGYFRAGEGLMASAEQVLTPLFATLAAGLGDDPDAVTRSMARVAWPSGVS